MDDPWWDWIPPHPHWDAVLRLLPAHIFLFDTALICRYAAPSGVAFLGQSPAQLTGRHAGEILPPAANGLRLMLERAAGEGAPWSTPHYRYRHGAGDEASAYIWAIDVAPLRLAEQQVVLVTLHDVLELVEECDRLRERMAAREQELRAAEERIRTSLTAAFGYLQLLAERPRLLADESLSLTIEHRLLPQLQEILETVEALERSPGADWQSTS